ncbi:MAG: phytoene desaturase family protein [Acetobacteraceae bacterium]|nr:phytoene desaturase family protein [Acetobacteraceae bacterium]
MRVAVIGAGVAGLSAALLLAARGAEVTVLERALAPGGKMREVTAGGLAMDAGPTVFTLRPILEEILAEAGASLDAELALRPARVLARHAFDGSPGRMDLFADVAESEAEIGRFAGAAEARGFRAFCARARAIWQALEHPFVRGQRPNPVSLLARAGLPGLPGVLRISPFATLWSALSEHFRDPRLRALFGRYATYCGSSPFAAPATLMLIAHVEQQGVWYVEGGMHAVARALARLAAARGAVFRYGAEVAEVLVEGGRAAGVRLASGERIVADAVVSNADTAAFAAGLFGPAARRAAPPVPEAERSLSALTWCLAARCEGWPLVRHNVFFSADYPAEFEDLFARRRLPRAPTVYVCAQDRGDDARAPAGAERLLVLVNAPATGGLPESEIETCERTTFALLRRAGLSLLPEASVRTTPREFAALFPATGGALYGRATHGWQASFLRPGARSAIPGLYLAGGGAHPGAGVPMAAMSGRLAAEAVIADRSRFRSMSRFRRTATPGGMPMPSPTTGGTASR